MGHETLEALEARRLMAVDLAISYELNGGLPLTTSIQTDQNVRFTVTNRGSTSAPLAIGAELFVSADRKFDSDDELIASAAFPLGLRAGRSDVFSDEVSLPDEPGRYYLIAVLDRSGLYSLDSPYKDSNTSNNALVSRKPLVTIVPQLLTGTINGTDSSDKIGIIYSGDQLVVGVNGALSASAKTSFGFLTVNALGGNDRVACNPDMATPLIINGGTGTDRLVGGFASDTIDGGSQSDRLFGGSGNDELIGGGGNDRFFGGAGIDICAGGEGGDFFYVKDDGSIDQINGGNGLDAAQYDKADVRTSIEVFIP